MNTHFLQHRSARLLCVGCMGIVAAAVLGSSTSARGIRTESVHRAGSVMTIADHPAAVVLMSMGVVCALRSPVWWREEYETATA